MPELGLQRRDTGLQRLVFLAREPGHLLDRLELLALDQIEVAQPFLRLGADQGVDLAPTPWATPAASFISRANSSNKRLLVWVIVRLDG